MGFLALQDPHAADPQNLHHNWHHQQRVEEHVDMDLLHQNSNDHSQDTFTQYSTCDDIAGLVLLEGKAILSADGEDEDEDWRHWDSKEDGTEIAGED